MTGLTNSFAASLSMPGHHTLVRMVASLPHFQDDFHAPTSAKLTAKLLWEYNSSSTKNKLSNVALNSPCTGRYSLNSIACHLPFKRQSRTLFSSGSSSDVLSISRVVKASGVDSWATYFTYSSVSSSPLGCGTGKRSRDNESAMFLGPGMYFTLYNNQIIARALIGQSAVGYCAGKATEKSRVFWIII